MRCLKFSVLMSLYYKETITNLHDSLFSIASNDVLPDEVVIVYDGPLSSELEGVVNSFNSKLNLKIIRLKKNVGLGIALNHGLQACENEWVFRMDTDDICTPTRFREQLVAIDSHPEIDIIGGYIVEFDGSIDNPVGVRKVPLQEHEILHGAKYRSPFNHMTIAFKKSVVIEVGSYQHHYCMEDYNLWIRILSAGYHAMNLDTVLVNVRAGDSMLKRRRGIQYFASELKMAKLKYKTRMQGPIGAAGILFVRGIPRLLPLFILRSIYFILRR